MTMKTGVKQALWAAAGLAAFLAVLFVVLRFRDDRGTAEKLASKARRADLVVWIQLELTSASEAEKSAVMAVTDEASRKFADEARATTADAERDRAELAKRLAAEGTSAQRALLDRFDASFAEFRRVDDEVLRLAVGNTNLKAYALTFGPAAEAVDAMNAALARVAAAHADAARLADGAQIAALHVETLLAPHVAEESGAKMDEFEARMKRDDETARADLAGLAALPSLQGDADVAAATSSYAKFAEIRARILPLSRENTNVRSLALSLNEKRKAMLACLADLGALRDEILAEPVSGATDGRPVSPR
jgi:hypothetical protein